MKKIKILKTKHNLYRSEDTNIKDVEMSNICFFLVHDYVDLDFFLDWVNNKKETWLGTNLFSIEKDNDSIKLVFDRNYKHPDVFETKKEYFIEMLKQWENVWKKMQKMWG